MCLIFGHSFHICTQELDLPILKVAAPEIVSGVSGESEQKLRDLFDQAVVSQLFPVPSRHVLHALLGLAFLMLVFFISLSDFL